MLMDIETFLDRLFAFGDSRLARRFMTGICSIGFVCLLVWLGAHADDVWPLIQQGFTPTLPE